MREPARGPLTDPGGFRGVARGAFAPVGELVAVEDGERLVCHGCGRAFASLGAHVRRHGLTAQAYREAYGLNRQSSLDAPAMQQRRREIGLVRYATNRLLREGLAVGMAMTASGELLRLSHAAQPPGSARPQARQRRRLVTAPTRQRASRVAAARRRERLRELGFAGDLPGYLCDAYEVRRLPVLAVARELGVGNDVIQRMLREAGIARRPTGGAGPARRQRSRPARQPVPGRLDGLGHPGDLTGYLRDAYEIRWLPVLEIATELGVGRVTVLRMLDAARITRRPERAPRRPPPAG